jgi:hypothetical protein
MAQSDDDLAGLSDHSIDSAAGLAVPWAFNASKGQHGQMSYDNLHGYLGHVGCAEFWWC